jgi:hypothetical protein
MFESSFDLSQIRSALTDTGHTIVGFATLAIKKGTEVRFDVAKKFGPQIDQINGQINELRGQALLLAERADETASEIEDRVEPLVHRVTDRLPAPAASLARTIQTQGKALRHKAHEAVVDVLTIGDAPAKPAKSAKSAIAGKTVSEPAKPAKKATARKVVAKKASAKKVVAKSAPTAKKVVAKKATATKTVAKKAVAKKAVAKKAVAKASKATTK